MTRRAALVLELLLALAMFVAAGMAVGSAVRAAGDGWARTHERELGADLAWSAMARIEAGISSTTSENGAAEGAPGSGERLGWSLEIETRPTAHAGLTLVEIGAVRTYDGVARGGAVAVARQLVRLRDETGEDAGALEGLEGGVFGAGGKS